MNDVNILTFENGEVSGPVDWGLSPPPEPFGFGFHRLHDLAGVNHDKVWYESIDYEYLERAFWKAAMESSPEGARSVLETSPTAVQMSFTLGVFLNILDPAEGGILEWQLNILPKFLR